MSTPQSVSVSFLGLGVMGYPMAGHLHRAGHTVTVYNRNKAKSTEWGAQHPGGRIADTPALAAAGAHVVFMCVGNDHDIRSVVYGDNGALAGLSAQSILVDHTTASAQVARKLCASLWRKFTAIVDRDLSMGTCRRKWGASLAQDVAQVHATRFPSLFCEVAFVVVVAVAAAALALALAVAVAVACVVAIIVALAFVYNFNGMRQKHIGWFNSEEEANQARNNFIKN
jgi:6-phosphogluconate dehydrogenase (decarboxylating)